jgi:hypothetical protein
MPANTSVQEKVHTFELYLISLAGHASEHMVHADQRGMTLYGSIYGNKFFVMAAALAFAGLTAEPASALSVWPGGDGIPDPSVRTDVDNAFDGVITTFYSLGLGGTLTVNVAPKTLFTPASVVEFTYGTPNNLFQESVIVSLGIGGTFTPVAQLFNFKSSVAIGGLSTVSQSQTGSTTVVSIAGFADGIYDAIRLLDVTADFNSPADSDGFDVAELKVNVVPLPAAGWMLLGVAGLVGFMKRRQNSVA